jgi:hypothetical protein|uniref:Uncharacterized protein n=1 Tax=Podoviridae sp. ctQyH19 TaxID=2825249 RepID=A0A8S5UR37_9CAUD|nr:MAG TPA: hypothetical protein [Podoviridae sp. ctQyH19]
MAQDNINQNGQGPKPKKNNPTQVSSLELAHNKAKKYLYGENKPYGSMYINSIAAPRQNYKKEGYGKAAKQGNWDNLVAPTSKEHKAFEQQSLKDIAVDTVAGYGVKFTSFLLRNFGDEDYVDMYNQLSSNYNDVTYGNWLTRIADSMNEYAEDNFKIYQHPEGDWLNPAFAGKFIQDLSSTMGMMAGEGLKQIALVYTTGGIGNALNLGIKGMRGLKIAISILSGMKQGLVNAHSNSRETYNNSKAIYASMGFSEAESERMARQAAGTDFKTQVGGLMALNALQSLAFMGKMKLNATARSTGIDLNFGVSGAFKSIGEKFFKNASPLKQKIGGFLISNIAEGLEEVSETTSSNYAIRKTAGLDYGANEFFGQDNATSFIQGVAGNLVLGGMMNAFHKGGNEKLAKRFNEFLEKSPDRIRESVDNVVRSQDKYTKTLQEYQANPTQAGKEKVLQERRKLQKAKQGILQSEIASALQYDYAIGDGTNTGYNVAVEKYQKLIQAIQSNDTETLQAFGIVDKDGNEKYKGIKEEMLKESAEYLDFADQYKKSVDHALDNYTENFEEANQIANAQIVYNYNKEAINEMQTKFNETLGLNEDYKSLSSSGKTQVKIDMEIKALKGLQNLSPSQQKRLDYLERQKEKLGEMSHEDTERFNRISSADLNNFQDAMTALVEDTNTVEEFREHAEKLKDKAYREELRKKQRDEALAKAKTKEEVEKATTAEERENDDEVKNKMKQAEASDYAESLAEGNTKENKPQEVVSEKSDDDVIEDNPLDNLSDEEKSEYESLANELSGEVSNNDDTLESILNAEDDFMAPKQIDFDKMPEDKKKNLIETVKGITDKLSQRGQNSFKDFINHMSEVVGKDKTDSSFLGLAKMYEQATGRQVTPMELNNVYKSVFSPETSVVDTLLEFSTDEDVNLKNEQTQEGLTETQGAVVGFTDTNKPIRESLVTGRKTVSHNPRAAYLGLEYKVEVDEQTGEIKRVDTNNLNNSEGNSQVLNPDIVMKGSELEVIIPQDYENQLVKNYKADGTTEVIPFKEWAKKNNVQEGSEEWNAKIPMSAQINGKHAFYIHDLDWFNTDNIGGDTVEKQIDNLNKARANADRIRKAVLSGDNKIVVTSRSFGSLNTLPKGKMIPLDEATGDTKIVVAANNADLQDGTSTAQSPVNAEVEDKRRGKYKLVNRTDKNPYTPGEVREIRQINTGESISLALKGNDITKGEKIDDISFNNVKMATLASIVINSQRYVDANKKSTDPAIIQRVKNAQAVVDNYANSNYGMTVEKAKSIANSLKSADIVHDLGSYIKMHTNVIGSESNLAEVLGNDSMNKQGTRMVYPDEQTYVMFNGTTLRVLNKADNKNNFETIVKNGRQVKVIKASGFNYKAPNLQGAKAVMSMFEGDNPKFRNAQFSVNKAFLGKNSPEMQIINESGTVVPYTGNKQGESTYEGYIKSVVKSDVLSHAITDGNGGTKYVTDVQPIIEFDLKSSFSENSLPTVERKTANQILNQPPIQNEVTTSADNKTNITEDSKDNSTDNIGENEQPTLSEDEVRELIMSGMNPDDIEKLVYPKTYAKKQQEKINSSTTEGNNNSNLITEEELRELISSGKSPEEIERIVAERSGKTESKEQPDNFKPVEPTPENNEKLGDEKVDEDIDDEGITTSESKVEKTTTQIIKEQIDEVINKNNIGKFLFSGFKIPEQENTDEFFAPAQFTEEMRKAFADTFSNQIDGLTILEQKELENALTISVLRKLKDKSNIKNKKFNVSAVQDIIKNVVEEELKRIKRVENLRMTYLHLNGFGGTLLEQAVAKKINRINNILNQQEKLTSLDSEKLGTVSQQVQKILGQDISEKANANVSLDEDIKNDIEETIEEEVVENIDEAGKESKEELENWQTDSLTKDSKTSFSTALKILLSDIKDIRDGVVTTNFMEMDKYVSPDVVYSHLQNKLIGLPSSFDLILDKLKEDSSNPISNQLYTKLANADKQLQNEILYKMGLVELKMYAVKIRDRQLSVIDENTNSDNYRMYNEWKNNFLNSKYVYKEDGKYFYNTADLGGIATELREIGDSQDSVEDKAKKLKSTLEKLGIFVSISNLENKLKGKVNIFRGNGDMNILIREINNAVSNSDGSLASSDIYKTASGVVNRLIESEIEIVGRTLGRGFKVDSKNIQDITRNTLAKTNTEEIRDVDSAYTAHLRTTPYAKNNFILDLLRDNEHLRKHWNISNLSVSALTIEGYKPQGDRITEMSEIDYAITEMGIFTNTVGNVSEKVGDTGTIPLRFATVFNFTNSDKDQLVMQHTPVMDLKYSENQFQSNFEIHDDGTISYKEDVIRFMTQQIFGAEFDRIVHSYQNDTNIMNYDFAAKRFLTLDAFNNTTNNQGVSIHDAIIALAEKGGDETAFSKLKEDFMESAGDILEDHLLQQASKNYAYDALSDETTGLWADAKLDKILPEKYLSSKFRIDESKPDEKRRQIQIANLDFVANNMLHKAMMSQLISGDLALFAPKAGKVLNKEDSKHLSSISDKYEKLRETNRILSEKGVFTDLAKATGENMLKRMAMQIAPGNTESNSFGGKYLQVFVNDVESKSSVIETYIENFYGKVSEEGKKLLSNIEGLENQIEQLSELDYSRNQDKIEDLEDKIGENIKALKKLYPEIAGYFEITGTDAQEYTTWKEHLESMYNQAKLSEEDKNRLNNIYEKLSNGEDIDSSEISFIMQPMKPLYAGPANEGINAVEGVNRFMYVKSSSFPLLPQLTRGLKLDKVRTALETLQDRQGKNVRMSYQSANKIGALTTGLKMDDFYNMDTEELHSKLAKSSLQLDRKYFKIQQETNYKTQKYLDKNSDDKVTMSTQMWKALMGNGVNQIEAKIFPNVFGEGTIEKLNETLFKDEPIKVEDGKLSGRDLDRLKFAVEKEYFDNKFHKFAKRLGIDENGNFSDRNKTIKALQQMLKEELSIRDYPENLSEAISLVQNLDGNFDFKTPLWAAENFTKLEPLIYSVISKQVMKAELPGNQLISTSSEGFEKTNYEKLDDNTKNGIIWLDNSRRGELRSTRNENGEIIESEVLLQSKFRVSTIKDGKLVTELIDFSKPPYLKEVDGVKVIDTSKIDPDLLSRFSLRIPVSSHQSGVMLKVVGFLPEASGDMIVVPKEHTQQLGEDYDIDKRFTYGNNYFVDSEGNIKKLNYDNIDEAIKTISERTGQDAYKLRKDFENQISENIMIDTYRSVFKTPDASIQRMISQVLSTDKAKESVKIIQERINENIKAKKESFSVFDSDYQRVNMETGASGKLGTAMYSSAIPFNFQLQRIGGLEVEPFKKLDFGGVVSQGKVGLLKALPAPGIDKLRSVADIFTEFQNSAVDNIKELIMYNRNENKHTMPSYIMLTMLGYDMVKLKDGREVHLPSLLMSQPIIRDYVKELQKSEGVTSKSEDALQKVLNKYAKDIMIWSEDAHDYIELESWNFLDYKPVTSDLTGDVLYSELKDGEVSTWTQHNQLSALRFMMQLNNEFSNLNDIRKIINKQDLGRDSFGVNKLENTLTDLLKESDPYIGKFMEASRQADGSISLNETNPLTSEANIVLNGLKVGGVVSNMITPNEFINDIQDTLNLSDYKVWQVVEQMKNFVLTSAQSKLFTGSVKNEINRLFYNSSENTALANYIKDLKYSGKYPNLFATELMMDLEFNGVTSDYNEPSSMSYRQNFSSKLTAKTKQEDFRHMLSDDETVLPDYNGNPMSPRKLAQEMITYAFLTSDPRNYRQYIPSDYLDLIGANDNIRQAGRSLFDYNGEDKEILDKFLDQLSLLDSQYVLPVKVEDMRDVKYEGDNKKIIEFEKETGFSYKFIYDGKNPRNVFKRKHYSEGDILYVKAGEVDGKPVYQKLDDIKKLPHTLFDFNGTGFKASIISKTPSEILEDKNTFRQLYEGKSVQEIMNEIANSDSKYSSLAEVLGRVSDNSLKLEFIEKPTSLNPGSYTRSTNSIKLNTAIELNNDPEATIMEEVLHAFTVEDLKKYGKTEEGKYIPNEDAPVHIKKLAGLYEIAKAHVDIDQDNLTHKHYMSKIEEFVAGVFIDPTFAEKLDNTKQNGKSLLEIFRKAIADLVRFLNKGTFSSEVKDSVYTIINEKIERLREDNKKVSRVKTGSRVIADYKGADMNGKAKSVILPNPSLTPKQNAIIRKGVAQIETLNGFARNKDGVLLGSDISVIDQFKDDITSEDIDTILENFFAGNTPLLTNTKEATREGSMEDGIIKLINSRLQQITKETGKPIVKYLVSERYDGKRLFYIDTNQFKRLTPNTPKATLDKKVVTRENVGFTLFQAGLIKDLSDIEFGKANTPKKLLSLLEEKGLLNKIC